VSHLSVGVMLSAADVDPADVKRYARHAERIGLDAVFVGDHLIAATPTLDSTVTLATVAAVTDRVQLGFGVLVLGLHHPAWAAKQVATLQQLSGNRVILGVGVGGTVHSSAGFKAVGVPYAERGRRADETLALLPGLIAGKPARLDSGATVTLAPGAKVPPIWVGGGSAAALRRTAEHGSAWFPSMVPAGFVAAGRARLAELAAERGRPTPGIAVGGAVLLGRQAPASVLDDFASALRDGYGVPAEHAAKVPITGTPAQAAERFAEYAVAGATHLVLGAIAGDWARQCELIAEARALLDQPARGR
jgi:alkanesulfonate monooxygenase SsuD/methylene tetrahydromethanopterin reductase-like flavin-dependent oxidoreductase (luciferase family)